MTQPWTESDGRLLRTLRERSGIDRANFARRNTLSVGQLTELEDGGQGRFYNDAIKAHKGHALLSRLGYVAPPPAPDGPREDVMPPEPVAPPAPPAAPPAAPRQVAEDPASAIDMQTDGEAAGLNPDAGPPPAVPAASRRESAFPLKAVGLALAAGLVIAGVFITRQPGPATQAQPVPQATPASTTQATEPPAPAASADGLNPPAPAGSPQQMQAPEPAPAAAPVTPAAPASAPASSTVTADARCPALPREGAVQFTPGAALRPAGYIYIEAASESRVCVVDGRDRHTSAIVRPGAGVTVNGEAPFTLHTRQWGELRVFFQGVRVNLAEPSPEAVTLTAR